MTTGKIIALTRWTFVGKVMSLLYHMLCRLVMTFLPRSKCLLISWLQSPSAGILETRKIKAAGSQGFLQSKELYLAYLLLALCLISLIVVATLVKIPFVPVTFSLYYVWNPPSMGFSRQKYWSGLPFPSPSNIAKLLLNLIVYLQVLIVSLDVLCRQSHCLQVGEAFFSF